MSPKIFITAAFTLALFLGTSSATQLKSKSLKKVFAQYHGSWNGYRHQDSYDYNNEDEYDNCDYDNQDYDNYDYDNYDNQDYDNYDCDNYDSYDYDNYDYDSYDYDSDDYDNYDYDYDNYDYDYDNYDYDYDNYEEYDNYDNEGYEQNTLEQSCYDVMYPINQIASEVSYYDYSATFQSVKDEIFEYIQSCDYDREELYNNLEAFREYRFEQMRLNNTLPYCDWIDCSVYAQLNETFWDDVQDFIQNITEKYNATGLVNETEIYASIRKLAKSTNDIYEFNEELFEEQQELVEYLSKAYDKYIKDKKEREKQNKNKKKDNKRNAQVSINNMLKKKAIGDIN